MKRVFKSREQRLLFIGKAQSLKNPSVSFPNLGQKNAHLLSLKIPPALRCCIMCHYIRWRGAEGRAGWEDAARWAQPLSENTGRLQSPGYLLARPSPPPQRPNVGLEEREREGGRLNQHRLGKLRSGAPQRWPLAITDTCPPPTRPPGSSIWGSLPGLVGAVISHYRSPQLWYQVRSWLLEPREEKHPGPLSPAGRIP